MSKLRSILMNVRVWIVLVVLLISLLAIAPNPFREGATIRAVEKSSAAFDAGFQSPLPTELPSSKERVLAVNNKPVSGPKEYHEAVDSLAVNRTVQIKTSKGIYKVTVKPLISVTILPELVEKNVSVFELQNVTVNGSNVTINKSVIRAIKVNKTIEKVIGPAGIGLKVYESPKTNIRKGLDLQGGTRVLMKPDKKIPSEDMAILIENMKQRLNVFGLSDVVIREAADLIGNQYIVVEIAGVNEEEVKELLAKQGKFEAKIGKTSVFRGGSDITYVCRSAQCSGIDTRDGCGQTNDGWACKFIFSVALSPEAAQRQAAITNDLGIITESRSRYLNQSLDLYLDDQLVDSLSIGAELKGKPVTEVSISGSGAGASEEDAVSNALGNMKRLQTILITGSLPVKLEIIKTDTVSPLVGEKFTSNALLLSLVAAIAVALVLLVQYRKLIIAIPILMVSLLEILVMLGVAAIIGWNMDLAAIAGIIAAVGTGVNDQIIITDEALRGESRRLFTWKDKIKNAFFIIFGAYITLVVAMIPLLFAGAGLLRGFALTTIIGISIGVFITRPAYASILEILLRKD